jgi:hypothetical protein
MKFIHERDVLWARFTRLSHDYDAVQGACFLKNEDRRRRELCIYRTFSIIAAPPPEGDNLS